MTEIDDPQILGHDTESTGAEVAAGGGSVLDKIVKRRKPGKGEGEFPIPSWGPELLAKMKVLDRHVVDKHIRHTQARVREMDLAGRKRDDLVRLGNETDMEFLRQACIGIIAHDLESDDKEQVATGFDDMSLAERLDPVDEFGNPIVLANWMELMMYLLQWNDLALTTFAQRVGRWMQDTSRPVEDPQ